MKMIMVAAVAACMLAFVGCEKEQTPAEKAAASLQQAAKDTQKAAEKAAGDVQKAANKAAADAQKK